jgi:prefoldin subunit 5
MENLIIEEANGNTTTKPLAASKEELNKAITDLESKLIILQTNASTVEAGTNLKLESLGNSVYALQEQLDNVRRMLIALAITSSIFAALVVNLYFN